MANSGASVLAARRRNQWLIASDDRTPAEIVAWLGAVQAQDYAGAKWALGLRNPRLTDAAVEAAFNHGEIVRTHILRPTWHFVAAADLRWMLSLSGPRVHSINAPYYRAGEVDAPLMRRARKVFERALATGPKTRTELALALESAGIQATGPRLAYLVMHAELDALICSGPRVGKQFTYVLIDSRTPAAAVMTRDAALRALAERYFRSHGPATVRDCSWWSGLPQREIARGIADLGAVLKSAEVDGRTYWMGHDVDLSPDASAGRRSRPDALLLPNYDESLIAYRDRQLLDAPRPAGAVAFPPLPHQLVVNGLVVGGWKRADTGKAVEIAVAHDGVSCTPPMLERARAQMAGFLERPVMLKAH